MRISVPRLGVIHEVLVDLEDAELWSSASWHMSKNGYVIASWPQTRYLHRVIMGLAKGDDRQVDHINRVRTDNRRRNLRYVDRFQNAQNVVAQRDASHPECGVHFEARIDRWCAQMTRNRKLTREWYLTEEEAVAAARRMRCDWAAMQV